MRRNVCVVCRRMATPWIEDRIHETLPTIPFDMCALRGPAFVCRDGGSRSAFDEASLYLFSPRNTCLGNAVPIGPASLRLRDSRIIWGFRQPPKPWEPPWMNDEE